jgi:hypothetical protein
MKEGAGKKALLQWLSGSFLVFLLVFGLLSQASAAKRDGSVELMLGVGFGPDDPDFEFGNTFGPGVGLAYEVVDNFQLRTDISYFKWDDSATVCPPFNPCSDRSLKLTNMPVFAGGRFLAPLTDHIQLFAELGLSFNFLKAKLSDATTGDTISESEMKLGLVPGLGIEFRLSPQVGLGANVRYNLMTKGVGDFKEGGTSFLSTALLAAYHF